MASGVVSDSFYRAFEEKFRGSQTEIRRRLEVYEEFIELIKTQISDERALDLGCGRGEWLDLLRDWNVQAFGVDLDSQMLAAARERSLDVQLKDAVEALKEARDNSISIVSAFHLAEHLPFSTLRILVSEAHRVLMPGGLLILETPNPENLKVGSHTFYLDPTHRNPLPPSLTQFLVEYSGFSRNTIIRLQQPSASPDSTSVCIEDIIFGTSPDYAVIAQKVLPESNDSNHVALFEKSIGINEHELVRKFDQNFLESKNHFHDEIEKLRGKMKDYEARYVRLETSLDARLKAEVTERRRLDAQVTALYNSHSWRLTAPLRETANALRSVQMAAPAWNLLKLRPQLRRIAHALRIPLFVRHLALWLKARPELISNIRRTFHFIPPLSPLERVLRRNLPEAVENGVLWKQNQQFVLETEGFTFDPCAKTAVCVEELIALASMMEKRHA